MEERETAATLAFHGVAYVVTVVVQHQELQLQVEVDDALASAGAAAASSASGGGDGACWTACFTAAYIEELTRKTGNFKRFAVFVDMLLSALAQRSDAVFIDLLTAADLELYRKRKMGKAGDALGGLPAGGSPSDKRYLILTYAVEFDRVHYPLPLAPVQSPTPEILQRTIRRLRQALAAKNVEPQDAHQLAGENASLREENRCLKNTLKQYCGGIDGENIDPVDNSGFYGDASSLDLQRELEASIRENKELLGIYQQYREEATQEIARLKAELRQLRMASDDNLSERESVNSLKQALEKERLDARRKLKESGDAIEETLEQMVEMKSQLEETQLKNRELMRQLAIMRAKAANQDSVGPAARPSATMNARNTGTPNRRTLNRQQWARRQSPSSARDRGMLSSERLQRPGRVSSLGYRSSDDERESTHSSVGSRQSYPSSRPQRAFRRFDPTAYQLEKERKLQQQQLRSRSRSPVSFNGRGGSAKGYASDSSTGGGYSSADSRGSNGSYRSTQSRGRTTVRRQREIDARLASPKRIAGQDSELPPRFRSPMDRPVAAVPPRSSSRGRTPSPARNAPGPRGSPRQPTTGRPTAARKNVIGTSGPTNQQIRRKQQPQKQEQRQNALLMDTSMDSFSDIDDRLTALQQFLKEAKQGTGGAVSRVSGMTPSPQSKLQ